MELAVKMINFVIILITLIFLTCLFGYKTIINITSDEVRRSAATEGIFLVVSIAAMLRLINLKKSTIL